MVQLCCSVLELNCNMHSVKSYLSYRVAIYMWSKCSVKMWKPGTLEKLTPALCAWAKLKAEQSQRSLAEVNKQVLPPNDMERERQMPRDRASSSKRTKGLSGAWGDASTIIDLSLPPVNCCMGVQVLPGQRMRAISTKQLAERTSF